MKKSMQFVLGVGLCCSAAIQSLASSRLSPKQLSLITGAIAVTMIYYKQFAASPYFPAELSKEATQLEKCAHYLYYEVLGYESKKTFKKTKSGDYRESRTSAKGLGWLYSTLADYAKLLSIPGAIFSLEKFIDTLMVKTA